MTLVWFDLWLWYVTLIWSVAFMCNFDMIFGPDVWLWYDFCHWLSTVTQKAWDHISIAHQTRDQIRVTHQTQKANQNQMSNLMIILLQFIVTLLYLFILCNTLHHLTYYIWTVQRFDALHSHPLIITPSLYMFHSSYMFHLLSCHYDTDISLIRLMIADNPYCRHSIDSNYVSLLCFTLSL